jgi:hypothetical protein
MFDFRDGPDLEPLFLDPQSGTPLHGQGKGNGDSQ